MGIAPYRGNGHRRADRLFQRLAERKERAAQEESLRGLSEDPRTGRGLGDQHAVPPGPAVAAVGAAARYEFLTMEVHHAIAAFAGTYKDFSFVNEHKLV